MEKIFVIVHVYDVDGGFGDAISCEEILGYFSTEREAKKYVERYNAPKVYAEPYDSLYCHTLEIREVLPLDIEVAPNLDTPY